MAHHHRRLGASCLAGRALESALTGQSNTCKFWLTCERDIDRDQELALTHDPEPGSETYLGSEEELLAVLTAVANPLRLRVIAELRGGRVHVSELARRLGISRPLLYMHLDRLEKAGLVTGHLELSEDGKAMKYFELAPFELRLTADIISGALQSGSNGAPQPGPAGEHDQMKESEI